MARELIILPRFKREYRNARKHTEFDPETLEYVFDALIAGERLPFVLRESVARIGVASWNATEFVAVRRSCIASGRTRRSSGPLVQ